MLLDVFFGGCRKLLLAKHEEIPSCQVCVWSRVGQDTQAQEGQTEQHLGTEPAEAAPL